MFTLTVLGSGSAGNCALLTTGNCRLLVDAGLSARQTVARLSQVGIAPEQLDGVLLTHEHCDHASGLDVLCRKFKELPIYCNALTAEVLRHDGGCLAKHGNWHLFKTGGDFEIKDIGIQTFPVPHERRRSRRLHVSPWPRRPGLPDGPRLRHQAGPRTGARRDNPAHRNQPRQRVAQRGHETPVVGQAAHHEPPRPSFQRGGRRRGRANARGRRETPARGARPPEPRLQPARPGHPHDAHPGRRGRGDAGNHRGVAGGSQRPPSRRGPRARPDPHRAGTRRPALGRSVLRCSGQNRDTLQMDLFGALAC